MEPITATMMPFGKTFGALGGFAFGFLSIVLYDLILQAVNIPAFGVQTTFGEWTFVTGIAFGLLGAASHYFFRNKKGTPLQYALFAIPATIGYDLLTGVIYSPLRYPDTSFTEAFTGQIPFTVNHLISSIVLALVISPLIQRWITENPALELSSLLNKTDQTSS